ncbi:MAG: NAD kinase [Bacteroidetes bacterium]|nr:NAD kinase [Bacteroidota bacterium]
MIAIYGKTFQPSNAGFAQNMFDCLDRKGMKYIVERKFLQLLKNEINLKVKCEDFEKPDDIKSATDMVFSIGGDGTILDTVVWIKESEIPVLGINFGRMGFLASIGKDHIDAAIDAVEKGTFWIDKRSMLELQCSKPLFANNFALNDMAIQRRDHSSMITVTVRMNGELLNTYWADGLIVATPTGSTGYSLSCGGPILYPGSGNFVITPVAPHNLNVRPIVVIDNSILTFEVAGRGDSFLCTLDSRFRSIDSSYQLTVQKAKFNAHIVRLGGQSFLSTLKEKLNWGTDRETNK